MAIIQISRDWGSNPCIVRITSNDSYTDIIETGYLTEQNTNITALNDGEWTWLSGDTILVNFDVNSSAFFNISPDFATLLPQGGDSAAGFARVLEVAANGNDSTGNGSIDRPFRTIAGAMNFVTDAAIDNQYIVHKNGSITEPMSGTVLKPWIHIFGDGSPWYVPSISLDTSFNTVNNVSMWYLNLSFASDGNFDLIFTDASVVFGHLNFVNCTYTRSSGIITPTIQFTLSSPHGYHHFNFDQCIFSEANDGDRIAIACDNGTAAPLDWNGGRLPSIIDYSNCTPNGAEWINISGAACSGSNTTLSCRNSSVYLAGISGIYGGLLVSAGDNNQIRYDASVNNVAVFNETGTGNTFTPLTTDKVVATTYSPVNYVLPNSPVFGSGFTVYDQFHGIDNALPGGSSHQPEAGYIWQIPIFWTAIDELTMGKGSISAFNSSGNTKLLTYSTFTSILLSTNGLNGLDTGSIAASTLYYILAIGGDAVVPGFIASADPQNAVMPAGYTYGRIQDAVITASDSHILRFSMQGSGNRREYDWNDAPHISTLNIFSNTGGSYTVNTLIVQPENIGIGIYGAVQSNLIKIIIGVQGAGTAGDDCSVGSPTSAAFKFARTYLQVSTIPNTTEAIINNDGTNQLEVDVNSIGATVGFIQATGFSIDI